MLIYDKSGRDLGHRILLSVFVVEILTMQESIARLDLRVVTGMFILKQNCGGIWSSNRFLSLMILWWTVHASTCIYKQYVNESQVNEAMQ